MNQESATAAEQKTTDQESVPCVLGAASPRVIELMPTVYLVEYMARYAEDGCGILAAYDNEEAAIKHADSYAADDPWSSYIYYVTSLELKSTYK